MNPPSTELQALVAAYVAGDAGPAQVDALTRLLQSDPVGRGHQANFIDAVRSRNRETLNSELEVGHVSSNYCHLANISVRCGSRGQAPAAASMTPEFSDALARMRDHLGANQVDPERTPLTLGPRLTFDPTTERFTGEAADWANMYLRRSYRAPYTLTPQSSS